jgi:hypothetical protein
MLFMDNYANILPGLDFHAASTHVAAVVPDDVNLKIGRGTQVLFIDSFGLTNGQHRNRVHVDHPMIACFSRVHVDEEINDNESRSRLATQSSSFRRAVVGLHIHREDQLPGLAGLS